MADESPRFHAPQEIWVRFREVGPVHFHGVRCVLLDSGCITQIGKQAFHDSLGHQFERGSGLRVSVQLEFHQDALLASGLRSFREALGFKIAFTGLAILIVSAVNHGRIEHQIKEKSKRKTSTKNVNLRSSFLERNITFFCI